MSRPGLTWCGLTNALGPLRRSAPRLSLSRRWGDVHSSRALSRTRCQHQNYNQNPETTTAAPSMSLALPSTVKHINGRLEHGAFAPRASCPGCGALAQTVQEEEAGYYNFRRRAVSEYLYPSNGRQGLSNEDRIYKTAMDRLTPKPSEQDEVSSIAASLTPSQTKMPLCDRCHDLLHHHRGASIHHPSMSSLEQTIAESPYKQNHVYHVLDAADFPMSLVPNIQRILDISPQRSKNRRAKHASWRHGRKTELSFIITRSDLLAPKKSQVDHLMPYLIEVLRDALGRAGRNVRLGNVYCVSSKRGWWTRQVKEDIWGRGGAGWLLGKVNVGKSNLFELVFPKGRTEEINFDSLRNAARTMQRQDFDQDAHQEADQVMENGETLDEDEDSLLPPAREEVPFPVMPTVSSLPGTTASPIRIPFGGGKGELIDLPGLARGDLETFVRPEHRESLVMKARVSPDQYSIKPGQSLLLGGLVRITPVDQEIMILAYPFVPIKPHLTSTRKIQDMSSGEKTPVESVISEQDVLAELQSAGRFALKWDVTKTRAGPLTSRPAGNLKPQNLPFRVLSVDILIESLGWVELVAQVRRNRPNRPVAEEGVEGVESAEFESSMPENSIESEFPQVEVFSPKGKFISTRRPMEAWLLSNKAPLPVSQRKKRPRRSMSGG